MRSLQVASKATGDVTCGHKVLWANHAKEPRFAASGFARPRTQSPRCPDSDQIPQRSEMTRCAKSSRQPRSITCLEVDDKFELGR